MPITYGPPDKKNDIKPDKKKVIAATGIAAGHSTVQGVGKASIYEATASATSDVTVQLAIGQAEQIFSKADDRDLFKYIHDPEPIGPQIKVEGLEDPTLKAYAYHELWQRQNRKHFWQWIIGLVVIFLLAVAGWIA